MVVLGGGGGSYERGTPVEFGHGASMLRWLCVLNTEVIYVDLGYWAISRRARPDTVLTCVGVACVLKCGRVVFALKCCRAKM